MNIPSRLSPLFKAVLLVVWLILTGVPGKTPAMHLLDQPVQPSTALQQCLALPDTERLACYDRIVQHMVCETTNEMPRQSTSITTTGTWDAPVFANTGTSSHLSDSPNTEAASPMERMWELSSDTDRPPPSLYKPIYLTTCFLPNTETVSTAARQALHRAAKAHLQQIIVI